MSYEDLGPAPDIDTIDTSKMDFGNDITDGNAEPADEPEAKEPEAKEPEAKEPETEGEGDVEEVVEEAGKPARDDKGRFTEAKIPKSRFDEAVNKEREAREAAERRAAELERRLNESARSIQDNQITEELEAQIVALEQKHAELLLDGDSAKAAAVMKEIRMAERQIATSQAETRAAARTAQTLEAERMEATIARVEADYPEFNPESDSFDEDLVQLVLAKQRSLISTEGLSPSRAMDKAARDVAERFLKKTEPEPEPKGLAAAKAQDNRKQEAIKRALDTQSKQPSSMKDAGLDSDKMGQSRDLPDITKLTAEEFDALPEATKSRLRGDTL